jgi:hypothetical protein
VATTVSFIGFAIAAALQITALGFLFSWFLAWIGVGIEAAVAALVYTDIAICFAVILMLVGLLTQVLANQKCLTA